MTSLRKITSLLLVFVLAVAWVSQASAGNQAALDPPQPTPRAPQVSPTPPAPPAQETVDPVAQRLLQEVARAESIPSERLLVSYLKEWKLPLTGANFTYAKVVDTATGKDYALGLDQNGMVVDPEALRRAERAAVSATYGKLHPSLARYLAGPEAQGMVPVSIWLDMGGRDASIQRIAPSEAAGMSPEALQQYEAEGHAQAAKVHQEVEGPLLDFIPTVGGQILGAADTAPLVFAELPVQAIQQVADLPYVQTIDLIVQGGPEQDGGQDKQPPGNPEMAIARPASKANIVEARGFTGSGVVAAVVEGDSIAFANPYIVDGTCGPTSTCPSRAEHATAVGGIMASTHTSARGTAPGIGTGLLSANGSGWDLPQMQTATSWALGQSAEVFNNSYYLEVDGVMHNSDRWMDYIVRNYWDLEVKSAGNRGESDANVTSPGLGYNTLSVGAANDQNTVSWTDDTMAAFSSYVEPAGREKPEVTAIGCTNYTTGLGIVITGMSSPWIYDQGCGTSYAAPIVSGGGALLLQRSPGLGPWPEAEKAILIATALHNIEGASLKSEIDGAGAVDLAAADTVAANGWWGGYTVTPGMFDANNNFSAMTIHLDAGERVRVALAYDSNPSGDYASDPLEGDLDLQLLDASSTVVASSAGVDSWEIIEYTPPSSGSYTVRIRNFAGTLAGSEWTYAGLAVWPGHYVLAPYAPQVRDRPPGAWNRDSGDDYRLTRGSFWNAVGLRSPAGADYDVYLFNNSVYGDPAVHALRTSSTWGGVPVDLVVIDGNHAPAGNYYPTISAFGGTGNYNIEHATRTTDLFAGTYGPYTITPSQVVRVWDNSAVAGVRKYFALKPTSGNADLGMALFASDPLVDTTWYQARGNWVAMADSAGAGGNEFMNYQPAVSDWTGLVVWNNGASSNTTFNLYTDTSAPSGSMSINSGATYATSTSVTLNLSAADPETGVYQMRFSNNGTTWSAWEGYAATKAWTLTGGDGSKTVYVQYKNNAEMTSPSFSDTIILDTVAPAGSIVINGGASYATSTAATLTLAASDSTSGVYQMRFSNNGSSWSAWEAYATSKAWTLSSGDGSKTVYVQYRDTAGNGSSSYTDSIVLDTTAPTGSILINGGAAYANSTSASLSLSANDPTSGVYQMRFSNDGSTWTAWEAYAASKAWTLPGGDGSKTVYVQYKDNVGNGSGSYADSIILDTTAPTGSILINGGAAYANSTSASLTLSASDSASGVYQMRFSNDGSSWSAWEAYATSKAWPLPSGDGSKTVYVQYKDNAQNTSMAFTDALILDTVPPTMVGASSPAMAPQSFVVSWSALDATSGIANFDVQYKVGSGGAWTTWLSGVSAASAVFGPSSPVVVQVGETYYFQVRARDNAGNVSAYPGGNGFTSTLIVHSVYIPSIHK